MSKILETADAYPDLKSIEVNYWDIDFFDSEFAEYLLIKPFNAIYNSEQSILNLLPADIVDKGVKLHVRINKLPDETARIGIRFLRAEHLGKFIAVEGLVRKSTEVRPMLREAVFQCLRCYAILKVPQESTVFKEPLECSKEQGGCGRAAASTAFKLLTEKSQFIDTQKLEIQESPEGLRAGAQPERLTMYVEDDITGQITPGDRVIINGILRSQQRISRMRGKSTLFDIYLEGNSLELEEKEFEDVKINEKEMKKIKDLSKKPNVYDIIIESIAPSIYGMNIEKEALALQLFSGVTKHMPDETQIRGDIHILMVGDPGTAKCVSSDTEILLGDGSMINIEQMVLKTLNQDILGKSMGLVDDGIYLKTKQNLLSLGFNGKNEHSNGDLLWRRTAPDTMYKLTLQSGKEIKVTPTHLFFVIGDDANIKQISARKLAIGKFIATPRRITTNGSPQKINIPYYSARSNNAVRLKLPKETSPEFWRFIGLFLGEGYIQLQKRDKYQLATSTFTNNDLNLLEEVRKYAKKLGLNPSIRGPHKGKTAREIIIPGIEMGTFLQNFGVFGPANRKSIPPLLFKCSRNEIAAFISALFDSEGTVSNKSRQITIVSASNKLLVQLQHLLLRFDIHSQKHSTLAKAVNSPKHKKTKYYRLYVTGKEIIKFNNEIGFTITTKKEKLTYLCDSIKNLNTNVDVIPNIASVLKKIRLGLRLTQNQCGVSRSSYQHYEHDDRNPSRFALNKIVNEFEKRIHQIRQFKLLLISNEFTLTDLTLIRKSLNSSQNRISEIAGISQTLISQYELGKIGYAKTKPKDRSISKYREKLERAFLHIIDGMHLDRIIHKVEILKTQLNSDIFWDKIEKIEKLSSMDEYVYDFQVPNFHNFIANDIYVHNSQLLEYISHIAPRGVYASGKSTSAAGLTAAAVRDEFGEGRWTLEAGALVLADGGIACIDEIDKMSPQDRSALHEAMEQQEIHVAKAGITAALKSRCALLAAANPKYGRFDEYRPISDQIDLAPALLSRFDVIFPIKDKPEKSVDMGMAEHILKSHLGGEIKEHRSISENPKYSKDDEESVLKGVTPLLEPKFLQKYIAYARRIIYPVMTQEAIQELAEFYVHLRTQEGSGETTVVAITPRQLEALVRIAEASARMRLSEQVTNEDTERAIKISQYYLKRVASDSGILDIDMIATGVGHSQRSRIIELMDIIRILGESDKSGNANEDEVLDEAESKGYDREQIKADIGKLMREGRIFKPTEKNIRIV